jgi:hypothetical protein
MIICTKCNRQFGNNGALARHDEFCNCKPDDVSKVLELYQSGSSLRDISKLGFNKRLIGSTLNGKTRSLSDSVKLSHKLHPELYKHTSQTKAQMSESRKAWLREHKSEHNWRFKGESFPEKVMREWLETLGLNVIAEYMPEEFDRFFRIDFAILDKKIAIEVNGNQHYKRNGEFSDYHLRRQDYLVAKGWKVINVPAVNVLNDFENVKKQIVEFVGASSESVVSIEKIVTHRQIRRAEKAKRKQQKIEQSRKKLQDSRITAHKIILDCIREFGNERGITNYIAEKLNVTHTQVRRLMKRFSILPILRARNSAVE